MFTILPYSHTYINIYVHILLLELQSKQASFATTGSQTIAPPPAPREAPTTKTNEKPSSRESLFDPIGYYQQQESRPGTVATAPGLTQSSSLLEDHQHTPTQLSDKVNKHTPCFATYNHYLMFIIWKDRY